MSAEAADKATTPTRVRGSRWLVAALILSLALNAMGAGVLLLKAKRAGGFGRLWANWNSSGDEVMRRHGEERRALFSGLPATASPIVFAGDSLVEEGAWSELFAYRQPILNRGVSAEKIADLRARIGEIQARRPKAVILMIGINDLLAKRSKEEMLSNYQSLLKDLATSPETKVIVHGLLPVNRGLNPALNATPSEIASFNQDLHRLAVENGAVFVDLSDRFRDTNGALRQDLTRDGLHLNAAGYLAWSEGLRKTIEEITPPASTQP